MNLHQAGQRMRPRARARLLAGLRGSQSREYPRGVPDQAGGLTCPEARTAVTQAAIAAPPINPPHVHVMTYSLQSPVTRDPVVRYRARGGEDKYVTVIVEPCGPGEH
jgi:hypothetical protein